MNINMKIKGKSKNSIICNYTYDGYVYNINKCLRGTTYRYSARRTTGCCRLIKVGESVKVIINPFHDHTSDNARTQKYLLKQEKLHLPRKTLQTPKYIFDDVSRRNIKAATLMTFKSIRSQLNRERIKSRPKLPQSIATLADELNHYTPICHIYKGSVTASDGKEAFLFSDDKLLTALELATEIYCDGTFSAPHRKWNHLGLRNSPSVILSMTMTIPLLPEQYFTKAYHILCNTCEENDPDYEKIKEFLIYVEKTWLSKALKISVYECPVKTNNAVESFCNVINKKLGDHHPNMWLFLEKLGNVIMDQTIDLKRLHNNEEVRSVRSRKSIEKDVKIFEAQIDLISGRLPLQQFLRMFIGKLDDYRWKESFTVQSTYRCSTRRNTSCQGLAIVSEDGQVTVTSLHDHPPNDMVARTSKLKQEIYRLCQESIQPIKKIFDDVCESDPEAAMHLSYPAIKSTLNRMRAAYKPPVPNSFASLSLELEKYDACKDIYKGTVIAEDGSMGFLFSNNELLNALNESTELFVDGTFSIVPRKPNIIQLYTIHIRYMNTGIATIFVLCVSRTKALYRAIWEKIIELAPALQNNVKFIMGDYEKAAIATLSEFFPVAAIHGCWFHFNQ
ncbi:uncharacterized protein [Temnothorax longispinosus]